MGLDMYLYKKTYVQNWEHQTPEQRHTISVKLGENAREDIKPHRIAYIDEQIGYWRKFNALHGWIIDNCGGGIDECQKIDISAHDLRVLLETLREVKRAIEDKDSKTISLLFPPTGGFFFGSTEVDEYYKEQIDQTIPIIEEAVNEGEGEEFYYQASW
jgi:hypothetical protein